MLVKIKTSPPKYATNIPQAGLDPSLDTMDITTGECPDPKLVQDELEKAITESNAVVVLKSDRSVRFM